MSYPNTWIYYQDFWNGISTFIVTFVRPISDAYHVGNLVVALITTVTIIYFYKRFRR